jgi:hypothetical protein
MVEFRTVWYTDQPFAQVSRAPSNRRVLFRPSLACVGRSIRSDLIGRDVSLHRGRPICDFCGKEPPEGTRIVAGPISGQIGKIPAARQAIDRAEAFGRPLSPEELGGLLSELVEAVRHEDLAVHARAWICEQCVVLLHHVLSGGNQLNSEAT